VRAFWFLLGVAAVVAAALGAVLPLVPTTPFLLLGALAFSRSSLRLESWMLRHPHLGPPIHAWRQNGAIARRTKAVALATMVATPVVSLLAGVPTGAIVLQYVILAAAAAFVLSRPEPEGTVRRDG